MKSSEIKFFSCKKNTHRDREKTIKIKKSVVWFTRVECISALGFESYLVGMRKVLVLSYTENVSP